MLTTCCLITSSPKDKFENLFLIYNFPYSSIIGGVLTMTVLGKSEASVCTNRHKKVTTFPKEVLRPTETPTDRSIQGRVKRSRHDVPV